MHLLSVSSDAKTIKGEKRGYLTGILYLLPSKLLCPGCSAGCRKVCLVSAGRGKMKCVNKARARKTHMFLKQFDMFKRFLIEDIKALKIRAEHKGFMPCVRLNGTSDIDIEETFGDILEMFPDVQFYDYTKVWTRTATAPNYHLTYSRSEKTLVEDIKDYVSEGKNVAVVFDKLPLTYCGMTVVVGDDTDLRFLDPEGVIVGLTAKGKAKKDTTGFVVRTEQ